MTSTDCPRRRITDRIAVEVGQWLWTALLGGAAAAIAVDFAAAQDAAFFETVIARDLHYPYGMAVGDLDRDGDPELTISDAWSNEANATGQPPVGRLFAVENLDGGGFKMHLIGRVRAGEDDRGVLLERHTLADMDNDGFLDVVATLLDAGQVVAFKNPARSNFIDEWEAQILSRDVPTVVEVDTADIDGDGKTDIVLSGRDGRYGWLKGTGALDSPWTYYGIKNADRNRREARTAVAADLDGDGDIDIVGTFMNRSERRSGLVVFENLGAGTTWRERVLFEASSDTYQATVVDLDLDGRLDILMPQKNEIILLQRKKRSGVSDPNDWSVTRIPIVGVGCGTWFELGAADFDGDGDIDIAASRWCGGQKHRAGGVYWFESRPDGWRVHALKETWPRANSWSSTTRISTDEWTSSWPPRAGREK